LLAVPVPAGQARGKGSGRMKVAQPISACPGAWSRPCGAIGGWFPKDIPAGKLTHINCAFARRPPALIATWRPVRTSAHSS